MTTNYLLIALILAGALIMLAAILHTRRILRLFTLSAFIKKWRLLYLLSIFFFLGYLGVIYIVWTGQEHILLLLTGVIFFFGAVFVYIVALIGFSTFQILQKSNENLEETITNLKARNDELEQFNYATSHDLKEPMNTVLAFTDILQKEYASSLGDEGKTYLQYTRQAAERMREMVESLMKYLQVGQNDHRARKDLNTLLQEVQQELQGSIIATGATLKSGPLPTLFVNEHELKRLLQNLISNSLKYRKPTVPPVISISAEKCEKERHWRFSVQDNGIGIDPKYARSVFQIFTQLHPKGNYEGLGLGLTMCKKIVEIHGGTIWVAPGADGTNICFTLKESPTEH